MKSHQNLQKQVNKEISKILTKGFKKIEKRMKERNIKFILIEYPSQYKERQSTFPFFIDSIAQFKPLNK